MRKKIVSSGTFENLPNIYDATFFAKGVDYVHPLTAIAKKLH